MNTPARFLFAALALVSCGKPEATPNPTPTPTPHDVKVVLDRKLCDGTDAVDGAASFEVKVAGEVVGTTTADAPLEVAAGKTGAVEVRATSSGALAAVGTGVIHTNSDADSVTIHMRPVNRFFPLGSDAGCAELGTGRAAHQATLLRDGRVLVTGGFEVQSNARKYLTSTEMVVPKDGTVAEAAPMVAFSERPRAFHGAILTVSESVLVFGGEYDDGGGLAVNDSVLEWSDMNVWHRRNSMRVPRTRAVTGVEGAGRVLIAGGYHANAGKLELEPSSEWFVPATLEFQLNVSSLGKRAEGAMEFLAGTGLIMTGGFGDGGALSSSVALTYSAGDFTPEPAAPPSLSSARGRAAHGKLGANSMLVAGGEKAPGGGPSLFSDDVDVLTWGSGTALHAKLDEPVADACSVALASEGNAAPRALIAGGLDSKGGASVKAAIVELASSTVVLKPLAMGEGRSLHTCTALADGSVLVVGGLGANGEGVKRVEMFIPAP